jgi:hypothetical protein
VFEVGHMFLPSYLFLKTRKTGENCVAINSNRMVQTFRKYL